MRNSTPADANKKQFFKKFHLLANTAQPGYFVRPRKIAWFVRKPYPVSVIFLGAQFFFNNFFWLNVSYWKMRNKAWGGAI